MSTPRNTRRKSRGAKLRSSRDHARPVAPLAVAADLLVPRTYPSAEDLFAQNSAWRSYVSDALRAVLGPAALIGAVGLAGCAGAGDASNSTVAGDPSSATLTPVGPPTVPATPVNGTGTVVVTPIPPVTLTPLPPGSPLVNPRPPTRVSPTQPVNVPRIQPATNPPMLRGEMPAVEPALDPPQVNGRLRHVEPVRPPIEPPAVPGGLQPTHPNDVSLPTS